MRILANSGFHIKNCQQVSDGNRYIIEVLVIEMGGCLKFGKGLALHGREVVAFLGGNTAYVGDD
jgi:hypothetical protein